MLRSRWHDTSKYRHKQIKTIPNDLNKISTVLQHTKVKNELKEDALAAAQAAHYEIEDVGSKDMNGARNLKIWTLYFITF